jgi:hypothetical protein
MPEAAVSSARAESQDSGQQQITDDLVRDVADKVFALVLLDLRIEQERRHQLRQAAPSPRGGW